MIGKMVSRYKILAEIGEGGMGTVYLSEDTELKRRVALKFVLSQYTTREDVKSRFIREARAIAALNHPNIITIYDIGDFEKCSYLAMEYVEGATLEELIQQQDFSIDQILDIAVQICAGVKQAHDAGIVHRDIKPANIIIDKAGQVKILDFGLAKLKEASKLTVKSTTLGTLYYMAPEQIQNSAVDHRADIFSIGVVLYEMITGERPFKGDYEASVMYSILHVQPNPLARSRSGVPEALQQIVSKSLDKKSENRYQGLDELLSDLEQIRKSPESFIQPDDSAPRRSVSKGLYVSLAIFIFAVIVGYTFVFRTKILPGKLNSDLKNIGSEVQATLELAYTGELSGPAPSAEMAVLVQHGAKADRPWRPLLDNDALSSSDNYRIVFRSQKSAYFYVFQIDNTGKLDWLFPTNDKSNFSKGINPVAAGEWLQLPGRESAFRLDDNLGVEHIYFVGTSQRWTALEQALGIATGIKGSNEAIRHSFNLQTRGIAGIRPAVSAPPQGLNISDAEIAHLVQGKDGVLVIERWFRHEAPFENETN